jgi:hypothetical protein
MSETIDYRARLHALWAATRTEFEAAQPTAMDVDHADAIVGETPALQPHRHELAQHQLYARLEGRLEVLRALSTGARQAAR